MRITNNMMLRNTSNNINGNKVNVDTLNSQMSSQKKIQRPSEDPVIAIRSLRLRSSLSEIDQYYENNIPDAESWMDVTETALLNMEDIIKDIRTQCTYGANDPLTEDDRNAILTQLEKLRDQVYSEGNTDYAGRTIFTGYRTNQKLTFMTDEDDTSYEITQKLSYKNIEEYRYYSNNVTVPTNIDEVEDLSKITDPQEAVFDRIRLSYGGIDSLGVEPSKVTSGTTTLTYTYMDGDVESTDTLDVVMYDKLSDWAEANGGTYAIDPSSGAVFIKETGELILGDEASSTIRGRKAEFSLDYTKTGFDKGEVRPEYYYNCTDISLANHVEYIKFDEKGNEIYQEIKYTVAAGQQMTVNTQASDVFDASLGRDVDALIDAVQHAIDANNKVAELEKMQKMEEYSSDDCQAALEEWLVAAKKERDYADDNMQKLYNSYIGNCDKYLEQVNLALTDVGSKGASLELTKNRVENQQTTMETLKSNNEDRSLSDIIIDYTAAYSAYEASLQAASKINQNTLLNYI